MVLLWSFAAALVTPAHTIAISFQGLPALRWRRAHLRPEAAVAALRLVQNDAFGESLDCFSNSSYLLFSSSTMVIDWLNIRLHFLSLFSLLRLIRPFLLSFLNHVMIVSTRKILLLKTRMSPCDFRRGLDLMWPCYFAPFLSLSQTDHFDVSSSQSQSSQPSDRHQKKWFFFPTALFTNALVGHLISLYYKK